MHSLTEIALSSNQNPTCIQHKLNPGSLESQKNRKKRLLFETFITLSIVMFSLDSINFHNDYVKITDFQLSGHHLVGNLVRNRNNQLNDYTALRLFFEIQNEY